MDFAIRIDPSIERNVGLDPPEIKLNQIPAHYMRDHTKYMYFYEIDHQRFGYIDANLFNVFVDIYEEWKITSAGVSHDMRLCGYTVLQMVVKGDNVLIYNSRVDVNENSTGPIGIFSLNLIKSVLKRAVGDIWAHMTSWTPELR